MAEDFDSIDASTLSDDELDGVSGGGAAPVSKEEAMKNQQGDQAQKKEESSKKPPLPSADPVKKGPTGPAVPKGKGP